MPPLTFSMHSVSGTRQPCPSSVTLLPFPPAQRVRHNSDMASHTRGEHARVTATVLGCGIYVLSTAVELGSCRGEYHNNQVQTSWSHHRPHASAKRNCNKHHAMERHPCTSTGDEDVHVDNQQPVRLSSYRSSFSSPKAWRVGVSHSTFGVRRCGSLWSEAASSSMYHASIVITLKGSSHVGTWLEVDGVGGSKKGGSWFEICNTHITPPTRSARQAQHRHALSYAAVVLRDVVSLIVGCACWPDLERGTHTHSGNTARRRGIANSQPALGEK